MTCPNFQQNISKLIMSQHFSIVHYDVFPKDVQAKIIKGMIEVKNQLFTSFSELWHVNVHKKMVREN